jgi:hypothetical protein
MSVCVAFAVLLAADELSVEALQEGPPAQAAEAVRGELASEGIRVSRAGKPWADLWLRKSLPTQPPTAVIGVRLRQIRPGSLLGVLRLHGGGSDYRGQNYAPGVFTLRYLHQPEDGDHQGTSDSRDFLALCPAAADTTLDPVKYDDGVKMSTKVSGKKHPAVHFLASGTPGDKVPRVVHEEDKERWLLECEVGTSDGKPLRLWIVVVGKAPEQ